MSAKSEYAFVYCAMRFAHECLKSGEIRTELRESSVGYSETVRWVNSPGVLAQTDGFEHADALEFALLLGLHELELRGLAVRRFSVDPFDTCRYSVYWTLPELPECP
jgi:hypothetical protein